MKIKQDTLMHYFEYIREDPYSPYYIHRDTGQILNQKEYDNLITDEDDDISILDDYIQFPSQNSDEGYQEMKAFAQTTKRELRQLLEVALDGWNGVYERFKNVMHNHGDYSQWEDFRDKRKLKRMMEWLKSNDIEPEFL